MCLMGAAAAGPQDSFRVGVDVVPVYATVTDPQGRLVSDLAATEFRIRDNGRDRPLALFKAGVQPMTIVLLLDMSPSALSAAREIQTFTRHFITQLLPDDRAALGFFSHVVSLQPAFSADPEVLVKTRWTDGPYPAGTALWDALDAGRAAVEPAGGRRVILVVTDGADNASTVDVKAFRAAIEREGILVYAAGLRSEGGQPVRELVDFVRATGGWYFDLDVTADLKALAARVAENLHSQYVLGFVPVDRDGRVHRIDVTVSRRNLTVRARTSYLAPPLPHR